MSATAIFHNWQISMQADSLNISRIQDRGIEFKNEFKVWGIYFATIFFSVFVHEIGHCVPAWLHGYTAIPTPAKNYVLNAIPPTLNQYISLGGIVGSSGFFFAILFLYLKTNFKSNAAVLAGAIVSPGMYLLRFLLNGRGHDGTEFQEAQSALGLSYSGHALDYFFSLLFLSGIVAWIIKARPGYKIISRLLVGIVLTIIFYLGLQVINNVIFDPIFTGSPI